MVGPAAAADDEFCARVLVGTEALSPLEATGVTYSVKDVEDLRLLVASWARSPAPSPRAEAGHPRRPPYQTLTAPITTERGEGGPERRVPRYPRPLPVQLLRRRCFRTARR